MVWFTDACFRADGAENATEVASLFRFRILDHLGARREVAHHPRTGTPVPRALLS